MESDGASAARASAAAAPSAGLAARVERLEALVHTVNGAGACPELAHVVADVHARGVLGSALHRVPRDYYERDLGERARLLGCAPDQLCKTLVFENAHPARGASSGAAAPAAAAPSGDAALGDARHVAVVLQSTAKLDTDALERWLRTQGAGQVRLRPAADVEALTGFRFNAVTLFGGKGPAIPLIVAKPVAALPFVWLGGGEPDVKLRVFTRQLLRPDVWPGQPGGPPVVDVTTPRAVGDDGVDD